MDREVKTLIFQQATDVFAFLVHGYDFCPPELEVDDNINFAYVTFMRNNLAIECILNEREQDVAVKIAHVFNGKKTPYYSVDEQDRWAHQDLFASRAGCLEFKSSMKSRIENGYCTGGSLDWDCSACIS